jgi:aldehyde dehydrogenase (NAD+)
MRSLITPEESASMAIVNLDAVRLAQQPWAAMPIARRLRIIRELRHRVAVGAAALAETVPVSLPGALHRTLADTLVAEVLPLLEACRFLEREAESILHTRHIGEDGRPVLLGRITTEVQRAPWGIVLVIAPANYPLLLPGVQALQALAAGNAVLWKPAPGTETCVCALQTLLIESGLDPELLTILSSDVESAEAAIAAGVDHVVLTGSAETGKAVLRQLAETLTPATMELSGCDAAFVLPDANYEQVIRALAFGTRFNGSATCMAPRRVFLVGLPELDASRFESSLAAALGAIAPIALPSATELRLREILDEARAQQAEIVLDGISGSDLEESFRPTLITRATPTLRSMREDSFAPILSVMRSADQNEALAAYAACPYALAASVFGPEREAIRLARSIQAGNIVVNDLIVPTADPRIPFGGRGKSGFGVTRGAEGLLAMTTPRTIQIRHSKSVKQVYETTGEDHIGFFSGLAAALHASRLKDRWAGVKRALQSACRLR